MSLLTPADSTDDLDGIAISKLDGDEFTARHNLAVAFHGDAFAFQSEIADHICQFDGRFELSRLAVNAEADHFKEC